MRRVVTVVLVFALLTGTSGVDTASLGAEQETEKAEAQRRKMADRVSRIPVNSVVEIRHRDGRKIRALLQDKTSDTVTVTMLDKQTRGEKAVIPLAEIRRIEPVRDHTVRNVLVGIGVGVGVVFLLLIGTCALSSASPNTQPQDAAPGRR